MLDPAIPADTNRAEHALRPLVIARKISGGTRSAAGSEVRTALAALFAIWLARGRAPFSLCLQTLITPVL